MGLFLSLILAAGAVTAAPDTLASPPPAAPAAALDGAMLEDVRGGDGQTLAVTEQTLSAVNSGNTVRGDVVGSGAIAINSGGLSGFSGVGNFNMNTGHNNNLQSTLSITVVMPPAAAQ